MNMEIRSKRKKMDDEETEAVATNKAVRSKRKKRKMMKMMNRILSHLVATRSSIKKKKKMNKEETEAVASNKAVRSKRKKKMNKEETEVVALRTSNKVRTSNMNNKEETESVAVRTSNQVRNYLNHDIILFILSKLPLKSFKRFECVCKSWATLFEDSYFNTIYTNNLTSNNNNHYDDTYLVPEHAMGHAHFYLLPGQRFEDRVKIDWPSPLQENYSWFYVLGAASINGILCICERPKKRLILWNPTTAEFKVIPFGICEYLPPTRRPAYHLHGFGYDHVTKDYKVIQFVDSYLIDENGEDDVDEDRSTYETFWMIYSLRCNSWRKLDLNIPNHYGYSPYRVVGVYTNGVCHWWARTNVAEEPNILDEEECLFSFNFSNELMFTTPSPSYLDFRLCDSFKFVDRCLVLLNESIALISTDLQMATVHISILGELGVRESWTKLFTVTCLPSIQGPIGVGNLSNTVLLRTKDHKLAWINLNTKKLEEIGVKLANDVLFAFVGKYKKSFLPIGEMNN